MYQRIWSIRLITICLSDVYCLQEWWRRDVPRPITSLGPEIKYSPKDVTEGRNIGSNRESGSPFLVCIQFDVFFDILNVRENINDIPMIKYFFFINRTIYL